MRPHRSTDVHGSGRMLVRARRSSAARSGLHEQAANANRDETAMSRTTSASLDMRALLSGEGGRNPVYEAGERDLRFVAGTMNGFMGAMMLIVPHQFAHPAYVLLARHISLWGIAFLLSGLSLLAVDVLQARKSVLLA